MANISRLPAPIQESYSWQAYGACRELETSLFFTPETERGFARIHRENKAKEVCASCPVLSRCLQHALAVEEPYGIWGGMTPSERAKLRSEAS